MQDRSLRFNFPDEWNNLAHYNRSFFGIVHLCDYFAEFLYSNDLNENKTSLLEIGSYKGESAFLFACSKVFDEIYCIDPHSGEEEALDIFNDTWLDVRREFYNNVRHFKNINLINDYSYNVSDIFKDQSIDLVYIDGNHSKEGLEKDINLYLPKCKHFIGGHDYNEKSEQKDNFNVIETVDKLLGKPDKVFADGSWIKKIN